MSFSIRSPLRYPGGKSRALTQIARYIPDRFSEFREPFVGGGAVFVYFRQKFPSAKFWINDLNYELYCFWKWAQADAHKLAKEIRAVKENCSDGRALFENLTNTDTQKLTEFERAVRFFVLNRISFAHLYKWELQYGMNNYKQGKADKGQELFIANYSVPERAAFEQTAMPL